MREIEFLRQNELLNMPLIEGLQRGEAQVLSFNSDGLVLNNRDVVCFVLVCDKAFANYPDLVKNNVCLIHNVRDIPLIESLYPETERRAPCYQLNYVKKEPPALTMQGVEFKLLDRSYAQFVYDTYKRRPDDIRRIYELLDMNYLFGVFVDGEIAGYCGRHHEGSMGLLEIMPKFRRRGLGKEIERFVIRQVLKEGRTPYGHVEFGNDESLSLQRHIDGLQLLPEIVMWHLYKRR